VNLYRVWDKYEPDHINMATGRRGQWRVTDSYKDHTSSDPIVCWVAIIGEMEISSTRPYPRGCIIRPHKVLNSVLAARRDHD
jgi:hypothetical protein